MKQKQKYLFRLALLVLLFLFLKHRLRVMLVIQFGLKGMSLSIDERSINCVPPPDHIARMQRHLENVTTLEAIERELEHLHLSNGGKLMKRSASAERLAIIVPYRNRASNLRLFLTYLHSFLSRQNATYGIYLIEPMESLKFNRALLLNIGFVEAQRDRDWDCFINHDVDMLPESEMNIYKCNRSLPKQMAVSVSTYKYRYQIQIY